MERNYFNIRKLRIICDNFFRGITKKKKKKKNYKNTFGTLLKSFQGIHRNFKRNWGKSPDNYSKK